MQRLFFAYLLITICTTFCSTCPTSTNQPTTNRYTTEVKTINGTIKITIGTTSGCGDTVRFITELVPIYEKYKQFLELEFIPWGRTKRRENGELVCRFGERDCWANRLHRCVLYMLKGDQDAQLSYMACEFSPERPAFLEQSVQCALSNGLRLIDVDYCMTTLGDDLEGLAEEASREPMRIINFVPFILFNDVIDVKNNNQAIERLESVICLALAEDPSDCEL